MRIYILHIIFFISYNCLVIGQSVNVPLDYWGYHFLERMEAKGLLSSQELRVRPISRTTMAKMLADIEKNILSHPKLASKTDLRLLIQLKGDFWQELAQVSAPTNPPEVLEKHVAQWSENQSNAYLDLYGKESIISNRGGQFKPQQLLSETTLGGILRGSLGDALYFYADARNAVTRGEPDVEERDENFDVSKGSPVVISGPNIYRDKALAYFIWDRPWLRVELGRDEIDWGPGFHGSLALSRNIPPADMMRLSSHFHRFTFTSAHMFLRSNIGSKYLAAHRIDYVIMPGLYLGGSETVVYGNRDIEFAYVNPLMPYHVAEHHLGDRDNNTMSIDITCTSIRGIKLYGEFFIDDMTTTKSMTHYFGNKFAFLCGGLWVDPLRLRNFDLQCEYARIEPYVYSHDDSINIYTHYDKIIGYWLGPNSDSFILQANYQMGRDVRCELFFENIRKGEGNANTISRPATGMNKKFLAGIIEHRQLVGFRLIDQLRRDVFVSVSYTYSDTRNLNRQKGRNSFDHFARFELFFNY